MHPNTWIATAISTASFLFPVLNTAAVYEGAYTVSGFSELFHGSDPSHTSYGNSKELYTEFSELTVQSDNSFSNLMNEASMQRTVFDWPEFDGEMLVRNMYTNIFTCGKDSAAGVFAPGEYNTVEVDTDDGNMTLFFDSGTNAALFIVADENGTDYEEVGIGMIVRKSSTLSTEALNGTYTRFTIGVGHSGQTPRGWGNVDSLFMEESAMLFDGNGGFTEQVSEWAAHRVITENTVTNGADDKYVDSYCTVLEPETEDYAATGTYSVIPSNGRLVINSPDGAVTNQVSPDGNLIVTALAEADSESAGGYFSAAAKQPTTMATNSIDAVYFTMELDEEFGWDLPGVGNSHTSVEAGRSYVFFNSDGSFSMRSDYWSIENTLNNRHTLDPSHGMVSSNHFTTASTPRTIELSGGTYTIAPNGMVTLAFNNGDMGMAQLSENGQYVVYGFAEGEAGYAERWMGVGIKRDAPPAATEPILMNNDISMTPTGTRFSASAPTNLAVEVLQKTDLTESEWHSVGRSNAPDGTLRIHDAGAADAETRFYTATFGIW